MGANLASLRKSNLLRYVAVQLHVSCTMRTIKAGVFYFAMVFGAGFALGIVRVVWLVPRLGVRWAELMEMPVMLIVIALSARWLVRRLVVPSGAADRIGMGFVALVLLIAAELTLGTVLRGASLEAYFAERDPVSGAAYFILVLVFTLMPLFLKSTVEHSVSGGAMRA